MKRMTLSFAALVVALTATAQLEVKELKLSNGMTVWLNEGFWCSCSKGRSKGLPQYRYCPLL